MALCFRHGSGLNLRGEPRESQGEGEVSDNQGQCKGKKVLSNKVYKLVITEARVGGSYPEK